MPLQEKLCLETAASTNATFLNNLERWLEATIDCNLEKNTTVDDIVKIAVRKYTQALNSNIEYHDVSAGLYESGEEKSPLYYRHKILAEIYRSILEKAK